MEEFEKWLYSLPLQTLTDELKEDIIVAVHNMLDQIKIKENE
jgi:hypothetical protein